MRKRGTGTVKNDLDRLTGLHQRYLQQARWTASIRERLFEEVGAAQAQRALEVGAGTGAITTKIAGACSGVTIGLDLDLDATRFAQRADASIRYLVGDGHALPFAAAAFQVTYCHFLLLWVRKPKSVLAEMARVTEPGGHVLAFAEPDYGGRIDHPRGLMDLGELQTESLRRQGAEPELGRRLRELYHAAGLRDIRTGVLGGEWTAAPDQSAIESEAQMLAEDLRAMLPAADLERWIARDHEAWEVGSRVLYVPTFYAAGVV
jgi:ubiquinone/menaquinone biosynthesis C-methylase UbiE